MVCEPTMKVITLMDVQPDGAGYVAKDGFNLVASTDEWMSPVFAEVGPDGAVWFADWQNFIIQHNPTPSVERGGFKGEDGRRRGARESAARSFARPHLPRGVGPGAAAGEDPSLQGAQHGGPREGARQRYASAGGSPRSACSWMERRRMPRAALKKTRRRQ